MSLHSDSHNDGTTIEVLGIAHLLESATIPGLTVSTEIFAQFVETIKKRSAILHYKRGKDILWVVFIGGTGTGKSTLFNALCGQEISETGVERPKTRNPVLSIPEGNKIIDDFPFLNQNSIEVHSHKTNANEGEYAHNERGHLALIDSPDVDSLEIANRQLAEDLYLFSDALVFVTSQEKYADDTPSQFLLRIQDEGKPCFFLFNKAEGEIKKDEVIQFYREQGIVIDEERFFFIPYIPSPSFESISTDPDVEYFTSRFFQALGDKASKKVITDEEGRSVRTLKITIDRLIEMIKNENGAGEEWLLKLDSLFVDASEEMIEKLEAGLREENQEYLRREIKKVFGKYDILAKPRRFVSQLIRAPLFFLGIRGRKSPQSHTRDFKKIRERADSNPLISGILRFNRLVLESLSPDDVNSPLYKRIREPEITLSDEEIGSRISKEQANLASWLEETFKKLTEGISAGKKFGIYSTSLLWGVMILLFEIVVLGGGITLLEAVLDSFIAPFVTKGSAELFAYHEIQKVAREMNRRYREGLLSIVKEQKERYRSCVSDLTTPEQTVEKLEIISQKLEGLR
jgi:energy-coupling factor transporter ATP-binding protein EcfA2